MGIARGALNVLCAESKRRSLGGRILTLGRMDIHFGEEILRSVAQRHGISLTEVPDPKPPVRLTLQNQGYISDTHALGALGFDEVRSLDVSDYEQADILFDLNLRPPPEELVGNCDLIFDGGTTEHVFHLPNALLNIHDMLKVGGRVVHVAPASNHMDHGFYMFSPTLFYDFYAANGYEINTMQVFRYERDHHAPWEISNYEPGCLWRVAFGGLDDALYGIICVATKREESTGDRIPTQSDCIAHWQRRPAEEAEAAAQAVAEDPETPQDPLQRRLHAALLNLGGEVASRLPLNHDQRRRLQRMREGMDLDPPEERGLGLEVIARY